MTRQQERAIEKVRELVIEDFVSDDYEIKRFEIYENEYFVSLVVEYGLKNDEGTMASVFARNKAQLFIGKRGGITYPVWSERKETVVHRRFKGYSILQAVCDQRM